MTWLRCLAYSLLLSLGLFRAPVETAWAEDPSPSLSPVSLSPAPAAFAESATASSADNEVLVLDAGQPEGAAESQDKFSRGWLEAHGITPQFSYKGEVFTNLQGGLDGRRRAEYLGSVEPMLTLDLGKLHMGRGQIVVGFQDVHGRGSNDRAVSAVQMVSNLDNPSFSKLTEAYYSDSYLHDRIRFKLGRQYADADFNVIENGVDFLNASYGLIPTVPMPTYPFPDFGGNLWVAPTNWLSVGAGVFQGDTLDPLDDTVPTVRKGLFTIFETKVTPFGGGSARYGSYHVGVWQQRGGAWMLNPDTPQTSPHGNYGVYATGDYWLRRSASGEKSGPGLFFQWGWAPADRNEVCGYWGAGIAYPGLIPARSQDSVGVGVTQAKITGADHRETVLETFYKWQVNKNVSLQPDVQWVVRPAGTGNNSLMGGLRVGLDF